jgi:micrococcal nuclease
MRALLSLVGFACLGLLCAAGLGSSATHVRPVVTVRSIADGDTLTLDDGHRIRLLQIDTPELGSGECFSRAARTALLSLVAPGAQITLESDPALDNVDRYGRLLRYIRLGTLNVNLELVRRGAAAPYFYRGDRGRYADLLLRAARAAKAAKRGLWGACPRTVLDPDRAVDTGISGPPTKAHVNPVPVPVAQPLPVTAPAPVVGNCAASYPDECIAPPPPDLDCKDIPYRHFRVVYDVPDPDPHGFDGDHDGIGCES